MMNKMRVWWYDDGGCGERNVETDQVDISLGSDQSLHCVDLKGNCQSRTLNTQNVLFNENRQKQTNLPVWGWLQGKAGCCHWCRPGCWCRISLTSKAETVRNFVTKLMCCEQYLQKKKNISGWQWDVNVIAVEAPWISLGFPSGLRNGLEHSRRHSENVNCQKTSKKIPKTLKASTKVS